MEIDIEKYSQELPVKFRRTAQRVMFLGSLLALGVMLGFAVPLFAQTTTTIFVELNSPAPVVVARYQAAQAGRAGGGPCVIEHDLGAASSPRRGCGV